MKLHFLAPQSAVPWDWRDPPGGSETAVCQLSRRLAKRRHDIDVYCDVPSDCRNEEVNYSIPGVLSLFPMYKTNRWRPLSQVDYADPGIWYIHRHPESIE